MKVDPIVTYTFAIQELHGTPKVPLKQDQISTEFNLTIFLPPKQTVGLIRSIFIVNSKDEVHKSRENPNRQKNPPLSSTDFYDETTLRENNKIKIKSNLNPRTDRGKWWKRKEFDTFIIIIELTD